MGNFTSCASKGALLTNAAANGDLTVAQELLKKDPRAALYHNFQDRTSPLIQASARGHFELVQLIVETAVCADERGAKRLCIDHVNSKKQSALMVSCKHGHPDCVEYLVTNGADPLIADERRHNTCLHFAALYGHSDCVDKLLATRTSSLMQQGRQLQVSQIPCTDEDGTPINFIDRHNGWGLTALHIAVFQGSVNTVRALLRHGASLDSVITPAKIENSPIRCAVGSNACHIAALIGNISMAKIILEAQESVPGLELRSKSDAAGLKPGEYAQRARNPVLVHLLDERLPVSLLRQIWMNYSLEQSMPPRHQTLSSMLQKLKLMFNLEIIAVQRNLATSVDEEPLPGTLRSGSKRCAPGDTPLQQQRALWTKRLDDVQILLNSVTQLHVTLQGLCKKAEDGVELRQWPPGASSSHEAVLDFILSTLITPRTVSAIVHAAKKLVCSNVMAVVAASGNPAAPTMPTEIEVQHGIALLTTALKAVDTCLQAVSHLSSPSALAAAAAVAAGGQQPGGVLPLAQVPSSPPQSVTSSALAAPAAGPVLPQQPAVAAGAPPGSSTPSSSFTAATAYGTRVPSLTSTIATETATTQAGQAEPVQSLHNQAVQQQQPAGMLPSAAAPQQQQLSVAAASLSPSPPLFSPHWSAQLHSLIAQLHWDIGVQRHRRRRQHAAQQAARSAAAGGPLDAAVGTAATVAAAANGDSGAADGALGRVNSSGMPLLMPGSANQLQPVPRRSRRHHSGRDQLASPQALLFLSDGRRAAASLGGSLGHSASDLVTGPTASTAAAAAPGISPLGAWGSGPVRRNVGGSADTTAVTQQEAPPVSPVAAANDSGCIQAAMSEPPAVAAAPTLGAEVLPRGLSPRGSAGTPVSGGGGGGMGGTAVAAVEVSCLTSEVSPCSRPGSAPSAPVGGIAAAGAKRSAASEHVLMMGALGELSEDLSGGEEDAGSLWSDDDSMLCSICMESPVAVQVSGCQHGLCVNCAFQLTIKGRELPSCPFCRQKIPAFEAKPMAEPAAAQGSRDLVGASGRSKGSSGATTASKTNLRLTSQS